MPVTEFHYRIGTRVHGVRPGHHRGRVPGDGLDFHRHAGLLEAPDPRRFDVFASMRDPFGSLRMRVFRQRSVVPVYALVDVSASMGLPDDARKLDVAADFVEALAFSASRTGDAYAVTGFDSALPEALARTPTYGPGAGTGMSKALRSWLPTGRGCHGLLAAAAGLVPRRALVFVLSDYCFPVSLLEQALAALARHDVVPVRICSSADNRLPSFGLFRLRDSEDGRERSLLMRPSLRRAILSARAEREACLGQVFRAHGLRELSLCDVFDAHRVTEYFLG